MNKLLLIILCALFLISCSSNYNHYRLNSKTKNMNIERAQRFEIRASGGWVLPTDSLTFSTIDTGYFVRIFQINRRTNFEN